MSNPQPCTINFQNLSWFVIQTGPAKIPFFRSIFLTVDLNVSSSSCYVCRCPPPLSELESKPGRKEKDRAWRDFLKVHEVSGTEPNTHLFLLLLQNLRGESVPDPYAQLVLDFRDGPGELTPEMVLDPSAFSSESHLKVTALFPCGGSTLLFLTSRKTAPTKASSHGFCTCQQNAHSVSSHDATETLT